MRVCLCVCMRHTLVRSQHSILVTRLHKADHVAHQPLLLFYKVGVHMLAQQLEQRSLMSTRDTRKESLWDHFEIKGSLYLLSIEPV